MKIHPEVPSSIRELAAVLSQPKPMAPGVGLRAHHEMRDGVVYVREGSSDSIARPEIVRKTLTDYQI